MKSHSKSKLVLQKPNRRCQDWMIVVDFEKLGFFEFSLFSRRANYFKKLGFLELSIFEEGQLLSKT